MINVDTYTNSYIVYARIDESGRVLDINSSGFVRDDWGVPVDEGVGDKYHHAQVNYIDGPLYTDDGIPRYKLVDGQPVERSEEEIAADRLEPAKLAKIAKSKIDLETYLAEHPLIWIDGQSYSITREKQQQLTSKILSATMSIQSDIPYNLKWNATGEECVPWSLENLYDLAFAIDSRVTSLVSYQQSKEVAINNAKTITELNAIEVDYDEV